MENPSNAELSLVFVDDDEIAEINESYLGHMGPTNVISFAMQDGVDKENTIGAMPQNLDSFMLGDIIISTDTAQKEADDAGITLDDRLLQLMLHGILHLNGYEHVRDEVEAKIMEKRGQELLQLVTLKLNIMLTGNIADFTV